MSHREPTADELEALDNFQRGNGPFCLVPVVYNGEFRYAIAKGTQLLVGEALKILAVCVDYDLDKDKFDVPAENNIDIN
jgi:hypothetical protein